MTTVDSRYPSQIHTLWTTLDKEVTWLHGRWIIYRQLFGTSNERVELLNESAGTFFNVLQDVLLHDVQLSLSKLGDPAGSGSRKNMTREALHEALLGAGEATAADKMKASMQKFEAACVKIRQRRNKWIAHFDRSTMLNEDVIPRMGALARGDRERVGSPTRGDELHQCSLHRDHDSVRAFLDAGRWRGAAPQSEEGSPIQGIGRSRDSVER